MTTESIKTIKSSGGDYTSPAAWEAAEQRDLVATDEIAIAECYDDFSGAVVGNLLPVNWTTSSVNKIIFRNANGSEHNGSLTQGFAMDGTFRPEVNIDFVGIRVVSGFIDISRAGCVAVIDSCVIHDTGSAGVTCGSNQNNIVKNNLIVRTSRGVTGSTGNLSEAQNNTIISCGDIGILRILAKNNVCAGHSNSDFTQPSTGSVANASSDSSGNVTGVSLVDGVDFTSPSTDGYSIPNTSKLFDVATPIAGLTVDILGNPRS
jgi:hypothetical protein